MIEMDVPNRKLNLLIPDEELQQRIQNWTAPPPRVKDGFLTVYARLANPAAKGAGIDLHLDSERHYFDRQSTINGNNKQDELTPWLSLLLLKRKQS